MSLLLLFRARGSSSPTTTKGGYDESKRKNNDLTLEQVLRLKLLIARAKEPTEIVYKKSSNFPDTLLDEPKREEIINEVVQEIVPNYADIELDDIFALAKRILAEIIAYEELFLITLIELDDDY